jgi:pyruvate dehydrogenase E2 component (dihydrolipoamide acetyltransferase)
MLIVPVYMPKYGMTMTEGLIVAWYRQEGDTVQQGEPLFAIETEKATSDVEAPENGTLVEIRFQQDEEAPVGEIVAYIDKAES